MKASPKTKDCVRPFSSESDPQVWGFDEANKDAEVIAFETDL